MFQDYYLKPPNYWIDVGSDTSVQWCHEMMVGEWQDPMSDAYHLTSGRLFWADYVRILLF